MTIEQAIKNAHEIIAYIKDHGEFLERGDIEHACGGCGKIVKLKTKTEGTIYCSVVCLAKCSASNKIQ